MAPRNRGVVPRTGAASTPPAVGVPTVQLYPPRMQASVPAIQAEGEYFDLDNVSGSEDDVDEPPRRAHTHPIQTQDAGTTAAQKLEDDNGSDADFESDSVDVHDANKVLPAADIKYFFKKSGGKQVCKVCRQVSGMLVSSSVF